MRLQNNILRALALMLLPAFCAVILGSCAPKVPPLPPLPSLSMTDAEAKELMKVMLPAADVINRIFFGEGLPYEGTPKELTTVSAYYLPLSESSPFKSIPEIRDAANKVYSEGYLKDVFAIAFDGTNQTAGNDAIGSPVPPRYKVIEGVLKVNSLHEGFTLTTVPDPASATVTELTPDYVEVTVAYTANDLSDFLHLRLVKTEAGEWRLDTPTY